MALTYKSHKSAASWGQPATLSVTGMNIATGDLIVVLSGSQNDEVATTGYSDTPSNTYALLAQNGGMRVGWVVSGGANADSTITASFSGFASDRQTHVIVVIFSVDSGDTVSLDDSAVRANAWAVSPYSVGPIDISGADAVAVNGFFAQTDPTWADQTIGGSAATVLGSKAHAAAEVFYRIFSSATSDVSASASGSDVTLVGYLLALKSELARNRVMNIV